MTAHPGAGSVLQLVGLIRDGDTAAAATFWERFVPRLLGVARRTLAQHPCLNGLADDVVQSVFGSFFRRMQARQFTFDGRDDVWNLLAVMTVRKARKTIRREIAVKRGGGQVVNTPHASEPASSFEPVDPSQLGPEFDLIAEEMLNGLSEEHRTVAVLRLMGHTNAEIAQHLDWTIRKVERKLQLIRLTWEREFAQE
jgi:RNA polymerase sigma factor (sigma-70 family)